MSCSVTIFLQVPGREEGRRKGRSVCQRFARHVPFNMPTAEICVAPFASSDSAAYCGRYHSDKAVENGGQHTAAAAAANVILLPAWSMFSSRPTLSYRQWFSIIIIREQQLPSTTDFIASEEAHTVHPTTTCLPKDIK